MDSALVLLSSGLDSTVNLFKARKEMNVRMTLTFDYGQRASPREIEHAQKISHACGIENRVIKLDWLRDITNTSLVNLKVAVPTGDELALDDQSISLNTAKRVWVPNRNGVFLNIAAAWAESYAIDYVIPGFNLEEAATFPDNSEDYMHALDNCFQYSTASKVKVKCFTSQMRKPQIVQLGLELNVPFADIWPCYFDGPEICGECESCRRYLRAGK